MFLTVILVMLTAFLALNLYRVLGKRTGHEQPLPKPAEERAPLTVVQRPVEAIGEAREPVSRNVEPKAEAGIRAIIAADSSFDVPRFLGGAQGAYRMILEAFWKGDEEQLGWLAEDSVRDAFTSAILARNTAGHVLDNRLVSIERAVIADASLEGKLARITVRFDADIAAVTRDAEGNVIAGSMTDAVETHDVWTFARTLKSSDPNWKLADTDEA
ncbi:Tim44/TimA family putative adaptor protein [Sphingomonas echinoides]|uniref:Tim44/TimA family putative adaptor protein n=1 Tax=Sphingomonas echinoides TaxID=59803 RepID=A0ABU4PNI4_9SPHN|nr:Tim44/TimA family putative adaptor protein [Sphingomonas echinoides]MDX5985681.1 Tim44/TimA family putative adaptor protein [Sphingomonas echinoides]